MTVNNRVNNTLCNTVNNAHDYIDQLFGLDMTCSFINFANFKEHARWLLELQDLT